MDASNETILRMRVEMGALRETGARLEYEIIPQAAVYLGYRRINFGFESISDVILEEGAHLGVRIMF